jgi:uncharacterized protein YodC (DUF2158 family)
MATFEKGDVVMLKSGGPPMTVDSHIEEGVRCVWFEKTERKSSVFSEATLEKVEENAVGGHVETF